MEQKEFVKFIVGEDSRTVALIVMASGVDPPKYILYKVDGSRYMKIQESTSVEKLYDIWKERT